MSCSSEILLTPRFLRGSVLGDSIEREGHHVMICCSIQWLSELSCLLVICTFCKLGASALIATGHFNFALLLNAAYMVL